MNVYIRKNNKYYSLSLFIFSIIYLVFCIEDLRASVQTGNRGADRSSAHIALLCITAFLLLSYLFNRIRIKHGSVIVSLVVLLLWTTVVNIMNGVSTWTLLVQENMSLLWILSYLFFEKISITNNNGKSTQMFAQTFFVFFICATIYYFYDMRFRLGRIPVLNVVYCVIALLPWLFVSRLQNRRGELLIFLVTIAVALLSMKRGAIIASILMILTYYFVNAVQKRNYVFFGKIMLFTVTLVIALAWADKLSGGFLSERFSREEMLSGSGRFDQYQIVFNSIKDNSFSSMLFGNGCQRSVELLGTGIHNEWLSFLFCYGIIGLVLYAVMFFNLLRQSVVISRSNDVLSVPCFMMTVFIFVLSMISTAYGGYIGLLLFGFWGYVNAKYVHRIIQE